MKFYQFQFYFFIILNLLSNSSFSKKIDFEKNLLVFKKKLLKIEKNIIKKNFLESIQDLNQIQFQSSNIFFLNYIKLKTLEAFYQLGNFEKALDLSNEIIKNYPFDSNLDLVFYIKSLIFYEKNYPFIFRFLPFSIRKRDSIFLEESFQSLKKLLKTFPNSFYAEISYKKLIIFNHQLINHQFEILNFYKKNKYFSFFLKFKI